MKICSKCQKDLPLEAFSKNPSKKDGLNYVCKECQRNYFNNWYSTNKPRVKRSFRKWEKTNRALTEQKLVDYLLDNPCVDCGEADILVLDFDHQGNKTLAVSTMMSNKYAWSTIEAEIAKCEVRCSNCHRRKTAKDTKNWRLKYSPVSPRSYKPLKG